MRVPHSARVSAELGVRPARSLSALPPLICGARWQAWAWIIPPTTQHAAHVQHRHECAIPANTAWRSFDIALHPRLTLLPSSCCYLPACVVLPVRAKMALRAYCRGSTAGIGRECSTEHVWRSRGHGSEERTRQRPRFRSAEGQGNSMLPCVREKFVPCFIFDSPNRDASSR